MNNTVLNIKTDVATKQQLQEFAAELGISVKGKWSKYRSITADADLRLHYQILNEETALFVAVGTHGQFYK